MQVTSPLIPGAAFTAGQIKRSQPQQATRHAYNATPQFGKNAAQKPGLILALMGILLSPFALSLATPAPTHAAQGTFQTFDFAKKVNGWDIEVDPKNEVDSVHTLAVKAWDIRFLVDNLQTGLRVTSGNKPLKVVEAFYHKRSSGFIVKIEGQLNYKDGKPQITIQNDAGIFRTDTDNSVFNFVNAGTINLSKDVKRDAEMNMDRTKNILSRRPQSAGTSRLP